MKRTNNCNCSFETIILIIFIPKEKINENDDKNETNCQLIDKFYWFSLAIVYSESLLKKKVITKHFWWQFSVISEKYSNVDSI